MMRGLVVARYLYDSGVRQSHESGFRRATALLTLHDAVEMLLVLGLQHHDLYNPKKLYPFAEYWTVLEANHVPLTQFSAMQRLNTARVNLKHHASLPGPDILEEARIQSRTFFIENTPILFGVNFEDISLSALVTSSDLARAHLECADRHMNSGDYDDALGEIAYAFHRLLNQHETYWRDRRSARGGKRALHLDSVQTGSSVPLLSMFLSNPLAGRDITRFMQEVPKRIHELQLAVRILGLGLDFGRWQQFMELTPTVIELQPGQLNRTEGRADAPPTIEECRVCYDFVIDSALRLQERRDAAP
jgi:hypothetical protein